MIVIIIKLFTDVILVQALEEAFSSGMFFALFRCVYFDNNEQ